MTTKEIYEQDPSKWVVYYNKGNSAGWRKTDNFIDIQSTWDTILIAKQHEIIADAIIANPDVGVEYYTGSIWNEYDNDLFFKHYDVDINYRLKPQKQDFNGGYIVASQEAYDLLIKHGYNHSFPKLRTGKLTEVSNNRIEYYYRVYENFKQFYINNGALSWDKPLEESPQYTKDKLAEVVTNAFGGFKPLEEMIPNFEGNVKGFSKIGTSDLMNKCTVLKSVNDVQKILTITDNDGTVYEFEKPKFKCELLKVTKVGIIGYVITSNIHIPILWLWSGIPSRGIDSYFKLVPIKQEIEVEKIVSYEFSGRSVVESREVVTIEQSYWDKLTKRKNNDN